MKTGIACGSTQMQTPIKTCKDDLMNKVNKLAPKGSTALGPGILASIAMAGEGSPGSQVIVCTDGLSNLGLGSVNYGQEENAMEFYHKIGNYAKDKGVTVHIVTIIGAECKIDSITPVSELTGGQIERVNPAELRTNFQDFLSKKVLATNV